MSAEQGSEMNPENEIRPALLSPQQTSQVLHRILEAVESTERRRWVELACAVVLSLATMASAWCAYQSQLWGGVQTFRLHASSVASRKASALNITALEYRAADASLAVTYMEAVFHDDKKLTEFLYGRFRPGLKKAVDAWLATEPIKNPNAPRSPFVMDEYAQPELVEARQQEEVATKEYDAAQHANQTSDTYVLLTVLFASVLFFGGIGGTFESHRLRHLVFVIALVLFCVTLYSMIELPICLE